jgi:hypothetical protein
MDPKPLLSIPSPTSTFRTRSHRKRFSVTRLSTDTTATLPAYPRTENSPDDRPPDYPESANEADADADHSSSDDTLLPLASPRPRRLHPHRRRHHASPTSASSRTDPYLDSLLARSVHALEMSNALLQSSISTHSSLSAVLAVDTPVVESSLEARARNLSSRIGVNSGVHANWLDDLAAISEHFATEPVSRPDALGLSLSNHDHDDPISRSLPVGPSPLRQRGARPHHRNHSSTDLGQISAEATDLDEPHLRLSNWSRSRLISPAPRAITQYVESNADADSILLPSTLGLRSSSSAHLPPTIPSPPTFSLPQSTLAEPSCTAYTLLSSFLTRRSSTNSTISHASSTSRSEHNSRNSTDTSAGLSRGSGTAASSRTRTPFSSPTRSRTGTGKRSITPPLVPPSLVLPTRTLTPPTENPSLSSLSSTPSSNPSSDSHPNPVLSLQALRKILDDQPNAPLMSRAQSEGRVHRRPTFLPRTPLPAPTLGTSTATASVSRLFTKPVHMHSGSPSREPRPSALKSGSRTPQSPAESDGFLVPGRSTGGAGGSSGSSARSTPKRISFADLPEPYGSERGGGSGRGFEKRSTRRKRRSRCGRDKGKGKSRVDVMGDDSDESDESDEDQGWWARLLLGSTHPRGMSLGRAEDRIEARIARGLGSRGGFGGGMEDWAV